MTRETGNTNLEKACDLLLLLAKEGRPVAIAEIGKQLGVSRPTVYSMLASFQSRGLVERSAEGKYTVGYAAVPLFDGFHQAFPFAGKALVPMQALAQRWDQTVTLCVYRSPCYLVNLWGTTMPHHDPCLRANLMNALTCAGGKLLMSAFSEQAILEELDAAPPELLTAEVDRRRVASEILRFHGKNWAVERSEHFPNRGSIAAAIYDRHGTMIACLSTMLQLLDFTEEREQRMVAELTNTALQISEDLGYTAPL